MLRKVQSIVIGALCVSIVSGCGTKISEVSLVSGIGEHAVEAKTGVNESVSLVDARSGKEVKMLI